jgi:hypothetical protein
MVWIACWFLGLIWNFMGFAWIMNEFFLGIFESIPHYCAYYSNSRVFRGNFRRTLLRQRMKNEHGKLTEKVALVFDICRNKVVQKFPRNC